MRERERQTSKNAEPKIKFIYYGGKPNFIVDKSKYLSSLEDLV